MSFHVGPISIITVIVSASFLKIGIVKKRTLSYQKSRIWKNSKKKRKIRRKNNFFKFFYCKSTNFIKQCYIKKSLRICQRIHVNFFRIFGASFPFFDPTESVLWRYFQKRSRYHFDNSRYWFHMERHDFWSEQILVPYLSNLIFF